MKTRGAVALRYFPLKRRRHDRLNVQQMISKRNPFFNRSKLSIKILMEEFKPVALENFELKNRLNNDSKRTLLHFWPIIPI